MEKKDFGVLGVGVNYVLTWERTILTMCCYCRHDRAGVPLS